MRHTLTCFSLALFAAACGGSATTSEAAGPQPRESDPALEHTWTMPAQSSALSSGDLGSTPPQLAAALMEGGRMPSIAHLIAKQCAESGALKGVGEVVLRFSIDEGGTPAAIEADPSGQAGNCLADALRGQLDAKDDARPELPAGAALLRVRLHPSA